LLLNPTPEISVYPSSHNFGLIKEGRVSSPQSFAVTNRGLEDLIVDMLSITGLNATEFEIKNDGCSGQTLVPAETCTVEVVFVPTSGRGKSAEFLIPSNDPNQNPLHVALDGKGIERFNLDLSPTGTGTGRVVSEPEGIDCGADCSQLFSRGAVVTLQAIPEADSSFGGWSGCHWSSGKTCQVTMGRDKTVVATFIGPSLTVTAPSGGEVWRAGTLKKIKWGYTGRPGSYAKIELLRGEVWVKTIAGAVRRGTGGKGHYDWFVPKGLPAGNDYRIRITSTRNSATTDSSDIFFTILQ
jgi:hypothetical protein